MSKKERHSRILEIIQKQNIATQEELALALRKEGYAVTQATVSRDIRELQLQKKRVLGGGQRYMASFDETPALIGKYGRVMKEGIVSMDQAQNILVVKTVSGMAMGVAAALDAMQLEEVVGCIAGDDTIMVASRSAQDAAGLIRKLKELVGR